MSLAVSSFHLFPLAVQSERSISDYVDVLPAFSRRSMLSYYPPSSKAAKGINTPPALYHLYTSAYAHVAQEMGQMFIPRVSRTVPLTMSLMMPSVIIHRT